MAGDGCCTCKFCLLPPIVLQEGRVELPAVAVESAVATHIPWYVQFVDDTTKHPTLQFKVRQADGSTATMLARELAFFEAPPLDSCNPCHCFDELDGDELKGSEAEQKQRTKWFVTCARDRLPPLLRITNLQEKTADLEVEDPTTKQPLEIQGIHKITLQQKYPGDPRVSREALRMDATRKRPLDAA